MANPIFSFEEAQRIACKASIMIEGLPGKGKSGLALALAYGLTKDWKKIAAVDTENKSLNLFRDLPSNLGIPFGPFLVGALTAGVGFKPSNYVAFREVAVRQGAEAVIFDSISHAWNYKGGVLDLLNEAKKKSKRFEKDSYAAWSDEDVAREKLELLELIRTPEVHMITTVRVKEKFDYGTDENGKSKLVSLGEQQLQQADLKYEPDLVLHMLRPGKGNSTDVSHPVARVVKSRYAIFTDDEVYEFTPELIEQLRVYLSEGVDPDVLLEQQRQDYCEGIKDYLDAHPNAVPIWKVLKADAGYDSAKLTELPLNVIKPLFIKLTTE